MSVKLMLSNYTWRTMTKIRREEINELAT
jgi:hypothetical protein